MLVQPIRYFIKLKGRACCGTVRLILLHSLSAEYVRHFNVFDHLCVLNVSNSGWNDRIINTKVRNRVLAVGSDDNAV